MPNARAIHDINYAQNVNQIAADSGLCVNPGKKEVVQSAAGDYYCYAIKTKTVTNEDKLADIIDTYARPYLKRGDVLFLSEKMVACSQGRAIPLAAIKPSLAARFLSRFVSRSKAGIGLAMPETMQCAIDECGLPRILAAAAVGALGKVFGRKGWFYHVAGTRAAGIDGPCNNTIPPYNQCVVLTPLASDRTAANISKSLDNVTVLVVDINDLGANILGSSTSHEQEKIISLLRQNPLGQSRESTPMGILRAVA